MNPSLDHPLGRQVLRTTDAYELVLFDRLPAEQRHAFEDLGRDPDFYGVLRPRRPGRIWKAVDRETALLLWTLGEPGPLPGYLWRVPESQRRIEEVLRLIADGVLAIESEGQLLTSAEALRRLEPQGDDTPRGVLAELSWRALEWTAALGQAGADDLGKHLYRFGQRPLSPSWERRLPDPQAVLSWLGLGPGTALRATFETDWRIQLGQRPRDWISFFRRRRINASAPQGGGRRWKLYLSPVPEDLPAVAATLAQVLVEGPCGHLKLGGGAVDLLRPDKCVLYFDHYRELAETAHALSQAFDRQPQGPPRAHGVPFTAEVDSAGLLSWGLDPSPDDRWLGWQPRESWRTWLVRRLAASLEEAVRQGETATEAARFALARLTLEGVDVERWLPAETPGQELL